MTTMLATIPTSAGGSLTRLRNVPTRKTPSTGPLMSEATDSALSSAELGELMARAGVARFVALRREGLAEVVDARRRYRVERRRERGGEDGRDDEAREPRRHVLRDEVWEDPVAAHEREGRARRLRDREV